MIRIGNGQGFWGDSIDAPIKLAKGGPLDYLTLDYLAEVMVQEIMPCRAGLIAPVSCLHGHQQKLQ